MGKLGLTLKMTLLGEGGPAAWGSLGWSEMTQDSRLSFFSALWDPSWPGLGGDGGAVWAHGEVGREDPGPSLTVQ